jgi:hypothetical protein
MLLTNLAKYKVYLGLDTADTDDDGQLTAIITAASAMIATVLGRTFEQAEYRTWLDGTGGQYLRLPNYPINDILQVSLQEQRVATLQNSGAQRAMVACDGTTLKLTDVSTAGVKTTNEITLADYPTVTALAAQIETFSGWSVTIDSGEGTEYTPNIKPLRAMDATATGRDAELIVPIESESGMLVDETHRLLQREPGCGWPRGRQNVFVWYDAGYDCPAIDGGPDDGNVPPELEAITNEIVQQIFDASEVDANMESERIGNYQYKLGSNRVRGVVTSRLRQLNFFRNYMI